MGWIWEEPGDRAMRCCQVSEKAKTNTEMREMRSVCWKQDWCVRRERALHRALCYTHCFMPTPTFSDSSSCTSSSRKAALLLREVTLRWHLGSKVSVRQADSEGSSSFHFPLFNIGVKAKIFTLSSILTHFFQKTY